MRLLTHSMVRILGLLALSGVLLGADLNNAVVVALPGLSATERKAVTVLVEESEKRTHIRWPIVDAWPAAHSNVTVIAVGETAQWETVAGPFAASFRGTTRQAAVEGYEIHQRTAHGTTAVVVLGSDPRGVLYGIGRLLREMSLGPGHADLPDGFELTSAPKTPLRGHQLGYRPKCNSYDAWDLATWEQYIRELAIFGCNAIELIPPRSDDDATSPHFPLPPQEMMIGMSRIAAEYGLDVWIWYPAMDPDYSQPATVAAALKEWAEVFRVLPRIDAVFVPGGDPGHTKPEYLMKLLEQQSINLKKYHSKAKIWVSPQGFNQAWMTEFVDILKSGSADWLGGIVHGPQVRVSQSELRQRIPSRFAIRLYPDITHSRQCQFPVPDWDTAFATTEARECINPRPVDEAIIFHHTAPGTVGFISYSEGCNDDVNKFVWLGLGWDPDAAPVTVLRDFSRWFIGHDAADGFAQGLLALERAWRGPLIANEGVETTLAQFQAMEKAAPPSRLRNWRFQQALFRACYDAYLRRRLIHEAAIEEAAVAQAVGMSGLEGSLAAMAAAEVILHRSAQVPDSGAALRQRIQELGEALFQSIGMQLSVTKYQAIAIDRGAALDTLDFPLNNRRWLLEQFARIRKMDKESERLAELDRVLHWTDPGPGGFYDDLGNPACQPHLVKGVGFQGDSGAFTVPRSDWEEDIVLDDDQETPPGARRVSWMDHAESLYDAPVRMHYSDLDPQATYRIRVVYAGDAPKKTIRLEAGKGLEVHPLVTKPWPFKPVEFPIPAAATAKGELDLAWYGEPGLGGNGRGCQVSEVWLIRDSPGKR